MSTRTFSLAPQVAWIDGTTNPRDPVIFAALLPDGPPLELTQWGWAVWHAIAEQSGRTLPQIAQVALDRTSNQLLGAHQPSDMAPHGTSAPVAALSEADAASDAEYERQIAEMIAPFIDELVAAGLLSIST